MASCHSFQPFGRLMLWRHVLAHLKPCPPLNAKKRSEQPTAHKPNYMIT